MNKNAPYIREIINRTDKIGGTRVAGKNHEETKQNVLLVLKQQLKHSSQNARTQTH